MDGIITLTKILRDKMREIYNSLLQEYYDEQNFEDDDEEYEIDCEDDIELDFDNIDFSDISGVDKFEQKIYGTLKQKIDDGDYKNFIYIMMLNDVYEYIKSREINNNKLYKYEIDVLKFLENYNIKYLLKRMSSLNEFALDIFTLYFMYDKTPEYEREKNLKLIELSKDIETLKKFKVFIIDKVYYQDKQDKQKRK